MRILVDGRVFSTDAHDRGMGNYTRHLIEALRSTGQDQITILLFEGCRADGSVFIGAGLNVVVAPFQVGKDSSEDELHLFTHFLSSTMQHGEFDVYVDSTPFISPERLELPIGTTISVAYDLIPLKHPDFYLDHDLHRKTYVNGLIRVTRSDGVIAISKTVEDEIVRYLGLKRSRISVLYPSIPPEYLDIETTPRPKRSPTKVVCMLGAHRSKNPGRALKLLSSLGEGYDVTVNAPSVEQLKSIASQFHIPHRFEKSGGIDEDSKMRLHKEADVVMHLSLEEGFGIPFAEALAAGRKVVALDVPINREIVALGGGGEDGSVLLLSPNAEAVDSRVLENFLQRPQEAEFVEQFRSALRAQWDEGTQQLENLLNAAKQYAKEVSDKTEFQIFSSIPGSVCGVADYSAAYLRERGNNALYFSKGELSQAAAGLPSTKIFSYLDYGIGLASRSCPTIFNFAFSPALIDGVRLMFNYARLQDVVVVHERWCREGLTDAIGAHVPAAQDWHHEMNSHLRRLAALPATFVDHLSPELRAKLREFRDDEGRGARNDLAPIEHRISYVPMAIDDRTGPHVVRAARRLRSSRGISQDAFVVGHFGLIQDDHKLLRPTLACFLQACDELNWSINARPIFLVLCGKVIDPDLMRWIQRSFRDRGLRARLVWDNPKLEAAFDAEMAATDLVLCLRTQKRGQMSHAFVRALSLGLPVLANDGSGWAFEPRTKISDDLDVHRMLAILQDVTSTRQLSIRARKRWSELHSTARGLDALITQSMGKSVAATN